MGSKKKNILKILLITLCLCVIMLFVVSVSGAKIPFLETYKTNFKHNITGFSNLLGIKLPMEMQLYLDDETPPEPKPTMMPAEDANVVDEKNDNADGKEGTTELQVRETVKPAKGEDVPVALDSAGNYKYADLNGKIVAVNETSYCGYNAKGELLWSVPIQMQQPQVTVRGKYVLINETGAKKILLFKEKKQVFETSCQENIISADLSKKGDVVVVTDKRYYKGQVLVYNKKGELIFAWGSGSYSILDAAISPKRKVAISLLNTDAGANSLIYCMDVNGKEKYKTGNFKNSVIFELEFSGENLNAIADNRCIGISAKGKTQWEHSFGDKTLTNMDIAANGTKLFLLEKDGMGELMIISAKGKKYNSIKTESMPNVVSIKEDHLAYNSGRDIIVTDIKGKHSYRASCGSDIKHMQVIKKDKIFCAYSSSIQIKKPVKEK